MTAIISCGFDQQSDSQADADTPDQTDKAAEKKVRIKKSVTRKNAAQAKKPNILYVGMFENSGFYTCSGGECKGFYYDFMNDFASTVGKKVEIVPLKNYDLYSKVSRDAALLIFEKVDVIIDNLSMIPNRSSKMEYLDFIPVKHVLVYIKDKPRITNLAMLEQEKIIVSRNSSYAANLQEKERIKGLELSYFFTRSPDKQLEALKKEKGTLTILENCYALHLISRDASLEMGNAISKKLYIGFGIKKNNLELLNKISAYKDDAFKSGKLGEIWSRYIKDLDYYMYFAQHG